MAHDVFISYDTKDKAIADAACAALEASGIRCWIAPRDVRKGEDKVYATTRAIKGSQLTVLIFTKSSNQSRQIAKELTVAVNAENIIVPFKIDNILPSGLMEYYLSDTHWLDAMNPPTERHIRNLVDTVKKNLQKIEESSKESEREEEPLTAPAAPTPEPVHHHEGSQAKQAARKKYNILLLSLVLVASLLFIGGLYYNDILVYLGIYEGLEITVTSAESSGRGTLRRALNSARSKDTITFDPEVFPPGEPVNIYIGEQLPPLDQGELTIDASNAGVILDGSRAHGNVYTGLHILSSHNVIMGLQIVNFMGEGGALIISGESAYNNIIGGDRNKGIGPAGQGNLVSGNRIGIGIINEASDNIVTGNLIGTDLKGKNPHHYFGNVMSGIRLDHGSSNNIIGPDNIIAFNREMGVVVEGTNTLGNTITRNSIYRNTLIQGIELRYGGNKELPAPVISEVDLAEGVVRGTAPPGSTVEIFSDSGKIVEISYLEQNQGEGEIFEGSTEADADGSFFFSAERNLEGPYITATATDPDGNTSEYSGPVTQND